MTRILVFDSGIGGLSVAREIRAVLPAAEMIYVADDAAFPYGDWEEEALSAHVVETIAGLIDRFAPDVVVIACNTASTLVLPPLRARFEVPFVGSANLAPLAEKHMRGETIDDAEVLAEIAPAFVEKDRRRTDMIVLACTHYPFLIDWLRRLAPWPVEWIDPAPAIARRVTAVVDDPAGEAGPAGSAYLTSGKAWPAALRKPLRSLGLNPVG